MISRCGQHSMVAAAIQVLQERKVAMTCPELIDVMATEGLWVSPSGKAPANTLYASISRIIKDMRMRRRLPKRIAASSKYARNGGEMQTTPVSLRGLLNDFTTITSCVLNSALPASLLVANVFSQASSNETTNHAPLAPSYTFNEHSGSHINGNEFPELSGILQQQIEHRRLGKGFHQMCCKRQRKSVARASLIVQR